MKFFSETFPQISFHPSIFRCFATMDVEKCKRIPLLACALAGSWRASSVVWVFREFDTLFVSLTLSFLHFHVLLLFLSPRYGADFCLPELFLSPAYCVFWIERSTSSVIAEFMAANSWEFSSAFISSNFLVT